MVVCAVITGHGKSSVCGSWARIGDESARAREHKQKPHAATPNTERVLRSRGVCVCVVWRPVGSRAHTVALSVKMISPRAMLRVATRPRPTSASTNTSDTCFVHVSSVVGVMMGGYTGGFSNWPWKAELKRLLIEHMRPRMAYEDKLEQRRERTRSPANGHQAAFRFT